MSTTRREFLRRFSRMTGCFVATATGVSFTACTSVQPPRGGEFLAGAAGKVNFPQGVASADPQPDAIVLWTRALGPVGSMQTPLIAQVADNPDFSQLVLEQPVSTEPDLDHTLRLFVQGLVPNRWYWYRFVTQDGFSSPIGRTCTAPHPDAEEPLRLAMFSCQNYETGYYNTYQRLVMDDRMRPLAEQTRLCIHVGDWYYENVGSSPSSMNSTPAQQFSADGKERTNRNIPSGGPGDALYGYRLDDFRFLHQQNLSDRGLLRARALYPFAYIWDDHELRNDYWQSYENAGPTQRGKLDSNQAWFEYCPAALSRAAAGPSGRNAAHDFVPTRVENTEPTEFDENYLSLEPNNLKAINSLTIYRTLSWGKTADLFLVDGRSYRGQRGVDNSILGSESVAYPGQPVDPRVVQVLAEGRNANAGNPPRTIEYQGVEVENPRANAPETTLLGADQKRWLKASLANSTARWKVLCNNVPMMRFGFDSTFLEGGTVDGIYFSDSWDGYPNERNELMQFIRDEKIDGVISLTGDRHAHYAGLVYDDYLSESPTPVMAEIVGASVSADCRQRLQARLAGRTPFFQQVAIAEDAGLGYIYDRLPSLNPWMLFGASAAMAFNSEQTQSAALAQANSDVNPHLFYADNDAYGHFRVVIDSNDCSTEFVTEPQPVVDYTDSDNPPVRRRVSVRVPRVTGEQSAEFVDWQVEGEAPLLGLKL